MIALDRANPAAGLLFTLMFLGAGCGGASSPSSHPTPPAAVMQISDELELAHVRLTEKAEKRLGVAVFEVKRQTVSNRRAYPGVVVVPPQKQTTLFAPVAGTVEYTGPEPLAVGTAVTRGQSLFSLLPLQTAGDFALGPAQIDQLNANRIAVEQSAAAIATRIAVAEAELQAAEIELRRSTELFEQKVGSRKRVDDAVARRNIARETVEAAKREKQTIRRVDHAPKPWSPTPLSQVAPMSGTILRVMVSSGQSVSAGQPLLDLVDLGRLWIRVRVPQSEASEVLAQEAEVSVSGQNFQAKPVKGPPTADQTTSTFDLYYELENSRDSLGPDQRVTATLALKGAGQHLVVPAASILYDIHGGAWVYVRTEPQTYRRVRVVVESLRDGLAVLSEGPEPGVQVVADGAAEIFGVEFGND